MTGPGTYWRTLRHLRAEQWLGRVRHRLHRPPPRLAAPPPCRTRSGPWIPSARRAPSLVGPARLRFLNAEHTLGPGGWDDPALARLWRYNLHYFDDLNAQEAPQRSAWQCALVERWITENPPGRGSGWEPYPTSLRIVNWIKWALAGQPLEPAWLHSLAVQVRWLQDRLETHLLGNHLFANAKALVFAGLFFDGPEAQRWLETGLALLAREIDEQFLADGGHFERSPMYHALALEDLLDLLDVIEAYGSPAGTRPFAQRLRTRVPAMQRWLQAMTHPDGTFGMFNDCAMDIAPSQAELERLATALGVAPSVPAQSAATALMPSGYVRLALGPAVALLDVAPIGPDYLPGHAHADTLSFELSLHGRRVVVNAGTSRYGEDARRHHERGTAAHSTVQIDGENSSEVWAGFRVGRRAYPCHFALHADGQPWRVAGAHDGYRFLPGRPVHRREWALSRDGLTVHDHVEPAPPEARARYLLAPDVVASAEAGRWTLRAGGRLLAAVTIERGTARLEPVQVTTRFGVLNDSVSLSVALVDGQAITRWHWHWQDDAHTVPD